MDYKEKIQERIRILEKELAGYLNLVDEAQKRIPMYQAAIGELQHLLVEEIPPADNAEKTVEIGEQIVG